MFKDSWESNKTIGNCMFGKYREYVPWTPKLCFIMGNINCLSIRQIRKIYYICTEYLLSPTKNFRNVDFLWQVDVLKKWNISKLFLFVNSHVLNIWVSRSLETHTQNCGSETNKSEYVLRKLFHELFTNILLGGYFSWCQMSI